MKQNIFSILFFVLFCLSQTVSGLCQSKLQSDSLSKNSTTLRPIDLVPDQPFWNSASADLFTFWLDSGLYGYYGPQPQIMLDHIPVNINFWGWQNLNMLPLHLSDISEMKSTSGWQLYENSLSAAGTVDFISREPESGLSMGGNMYWGNESGDPGPWIYDSTRVTPNVDRWGPDLTGTLSYKREQWYARSVVSLRNHQQTDPKSHRRLHRTMRALGTSSFNTIQTTSKSGLIETGYSSDAWNLKVRGIQAEDENYLFLQPFGREVPAEASYRQLALSASHHRDGWAVDLKLLREERGLQRRNSEHGFIFNWDEIRNTYVAAISQTTNTYSARTGFNWELRNIKAPGISDTHHLIGTYFFKADLYSGNGHKSVIETGLNFINETTARNIKAALFLQAEPYWNIEISANYNEVLPIQQELITYWIINGYTFFDELEIPYSAELQITKNRLSILELKNSIKLFIPLKLEFSARYLNHLEQNIPWQEVIYSTNFDSEPGLFVITQEAGSRFQFYGTLIHTPVNWLNHRLGLYLNRTLDGSDRYRSYFRQIPEAKITYRLELAPVENLEISIEGRYQSPTYWNEFKALDGQEYQDIDNQFPVFTGVFNSTVPSHFNIDVGARKWLWDRKLNLQFTIQNLFNDEVHMHPMGADRSLLFNIKAEARF